MVDLHGSCTHTSLLLEYLSLATCSSQDFSTTNSILLYNPRLTCCLILGLGTQHGAVDCFLACQFFFVVVAFVSLVLLVMDGAESTAPSPPLDVDLNQLLQVFHAQVRASAQRDEQLKALLETFSSGQPPVPVVSPAPTPHIPAAAKPIAVDRPTLLSSATLADFTAWSEAWDDYSRCQLLATQPLLTRMSAFQQTLDEDLRRFIREGIISIPDTSDVEEAKDELRKFIRRQRNPLLDRIAGQALNGPAR